MKKGYVTFQPGEYVLIDKYTGKFVVECKKTKHRLATKMYPVSAPLGRIEVLLLNKDEAFEIINKYETNYKALETNKVTITYGIKYGESGNFYESPLQTAINIFSVLEPEEKIKLIHYLAE